MNDFRNSNRKAPGLAPRMLIVYRPIDTIIHRREALTDGNASHAASARSFDDLARETEAVNAR